MYFAQTRINIPEKNRCQTAKKEYIIFLTKTMNGHLLGGRSIS